ncbi:hypothetical protein DFH07DRAFT_749040 [Mycena maculata]|uniref:BZIP domain-containing protein n=1 Tax=Mycena maculata TaxID=230809 RepID=A0AAD7IKL9_9AGAR|nr:hypothetical protein DFH07DRAFT_749040 [Mycena maculata]
MLSSTACDHDDDFDQPKLTSDFRPRLLVSSPTITPTNPTPVAISAPTHNTNNTKRQDVPLLNPSASFRPPSPAPRFNGFSATSLESPLSSPDTHVAINTDNNRPRTSQVFSSTKDLAAHYGIPQNLPPPPRPVTRRPPPPKSTTPDFSSMRDNYLTMLRQNNTAAAPVTVSPGDLESNMPGDLQSSMQALQELFEGIPPSLSRRSLADTAAAASPEFRNLGDDFDNGFDLTSPLIGADQSYGGLESSPLFDTFDSPFLTSPYEGSRDDFGTSPMDTPFSQFMPTPNMDMINDSPLIDSDNYDPNAPLFGDAFLTPDAEVSQQQQPKLPNTDGLLTFSPSTPALDAIEPASTVFPRHGPVVPPSPVSRRSGVTGTRKNLKPEALIPLDAPTQKRNYRTASATSRKVVPAAFKKRLHSAAFGDDADDEELGELSPTASEAETIEYKRRQNTLAARKSRKRKLEHQYMLEKEVEKLKSEVAVWRERAVMGQEMLRSHGIMFSFDGSQP